jgi:hypothetical protein
MNKTMKISHIVFIAFVAVLIGLLVLASKSPKEDFAVPFTEPVWTYWENKPGASTPEIVGRCYKNWKTIGLADNRIMLTEDNVGRFIPLSEMEKINKAADGELAVKSDFIALYLLKTYGGITTDSTVFMNRPLTAWFPDAVNGKPAFLFNASRYNKDGTKCPETFFMYSKKGHPFFKDWYATALAVGRNGKEGREAFIQRLKKQSPDIDDRMGEDYYLWVYLVGKHLLKQKPQYLSQISFQDSEKDPFKILDSVEWETDSACEKLEKRQRTNLTKLDNDLWKNCDPKIVPL